MLVLETDCDLAVGHALQALSLHERMACAIAMHGTRNKIMNDSRY